MIIDGTNDNEFKLLTDYLFSFDFPYKRIIQEQISSAIVVKEFSEYHFAFQFIVDTKQRYLPRECNGIFVLIQIKTDHSLTCLELYVSNQYVAEFRMYNIDTSKVELDCLNRGVAKLYIQ